jgi:hypothetical protein
MANKRRAPFIRYLFIRRGWPIGLALIVACLLLGRGTAVAPLQANTHQLEAQALLETLTVEERVGQLFMVTFAGDAVPSDSAIAELIQIYNVGGVAIQADKNNIGDSDDAPAQLVALINDLQRLALRQPLTDEGEANESEPTPTPLSGTALPLLIAMSHEGDGFPYEQLLSRPDAHSQPDGNWGDLAAELRPTDRRNCGAGNERFRGQYAPGTVAGRAGKSDLLPAKMGWGRAHLAAIPTGSGRWDRRTSKACIAAATAGWPSSLNIFPAMAAAIGR